jgi:hypothetical protein
VTLRLPSIAERDHLPQRTNAHVRKLVLLYSCMCSGFHLPHELSPSPLVSLCDAVLNLLLQGFNITASEEFRIIY